MKADSPQWIVMGPPATPAEEAALDAFRELLPEDGITTAWVNLTFIDNNGRSGEIDVLLLTRSGLWVVELKGWHGRIVGNTQRWFHNSRNVENPWLVTDAHSPHRQHKGCQLCKPHKNRRNGRAVREPWAVLRTLGKRRRIGRNELGD